MILAIDGCGSASFTWRGLPGTFDPASPHRVEIADDAATWTIDGAFQPRSATILAPATAATPEAGASRALSAGAQMVVAVWPPAPIATPRATLKAVVSDPSKPPSALSITAIDDDRFTFTVPPETVAGRYDVSVSFDLALAADACQGPPACDGVGASAHWEVQVE